MKSEIKEILSSYFNVESDLSIERISTGFANANYQVCTVDNNFLYRLCLQNPDENSLDHEIRLIGYLSNNEVPVAKIYSNVHDDLITSTPSGKLMLTEFINGHIPELNERTVCEIALAVGKLNSLPEWKPFRRKNIIHMDYCDDIIEMIPVAKNQLPEVYEYFIEQTNFLKPYLKHDLPIGLIHGDIFPDNTIYEGDKLKAIIDFEESCVDHLLMDVAMTINGFCFIDNELDKKLVDVFIQAYQNFRALEDKEKELLPFYIQWAAHGMLSWHLRYSLMHKQDQKQYERVVELKGRVLKLRGSDLHFL